MTYSATIDSLRAIAVETMLFEREGYSPDWMKSGWDAVRHPDAPGVRWRLRRGNNHALIVPYHSTSDAWILSTTNSSTRRRFVGLRSAMEAAIAEMGNDEDESTAHADDR